MYLGFRRCAPASLTLRGLMYEHRMDAMWLKATMSFVTEGARSSELDAPLLRQTPRSATVASILFVIPLGFEPKTHSLEGCCSIQLSYGTGRDSFVGLRPARNDRLPCKGVQS